MVCRESDTIGQLSLVHLGGRGGTCMTVLRECTPNDRLPSGTPRATANAAATETNQLQPSSSSHTIHGPRQTLSISSPELHKAELKIILLEKFKEKWDKAHRYKWSEICSHATISQIFLGIDVLVSKTLYLDILISITLFSQVGIRSCSNIFFSLKSSVIFNYHFKKQNSP